MPGNHFKCTRIRPPGIRVFESQRALCARRLFAWRAMYAMRNVNMHMARAVAQAFAAR